MRQWTRFSLWIGGLALFAVVPVLVSWGQLPDPLASHWGSSGLPDGSMPIWGLLVLQLGLVGSGALIGFLSRSEGRPTPESLAVSGLLGGIAVVLSVTIVSLNSGAETWDEAGAFAWWHVVVLMVGGLLLAWLGFVIGKRWFPVVDKQPASHVDAGPIDPDVVWEETLSVRWAYALLLPFAVVCLFLPGWLKLLGILFAVLAILFSKIRVRSTAEGLEVDLAAALTIKQIPIDEIAAVSAIDLEPREWAGWGYRIVPNGSAVVLRKGPAIEVTRNDGRRFAVTIDNADVGAGVLAGHLARAKA